MPAHNAHVAGRLFWPREELESILNRAPCTVRVEDRETALKLQRALRYRRREASLIIRVDGKDVVLELRGAAPKMEVLP